MKIVVALGGNALGKNCTEQLSLVKETAKSLVDLIAMGHDIIISHGNGPQVGMINLAMENESLDMPFAECGAMSQGYIGYHLQQAIINELNKRNIDKECSSIVTECLVDINDEAFQNPTKPIGTFYTKEEAEKLSEQSENVYKEDAGRGYRKVVASPKPLKIIEANTIKNLVDNGFIVIASGGGGIPVVKTETGLKGIDAVIDKDFSSAKLAEELDADLLLILTTVNKVYINYNQENQQELTELSLDMAKAYLTLGEFADGSMKPKVAACVEFVEKTNKQAIITSLLSANDALNGINGTLIKKS